MSLACASVKKANFIMNKAASRSGSRHRHLCLFQHKLSFIISPVFPYFFTPYLLSPFICFCGIHYLLFIVHVRNTFISISDGSSPKIKLFITLKQVQFGLDLNFQVSTQNTTLTSKIIFSGEATPACHMQYIQFYRQAKLCIYTHQTGNDVLLTYLLHGAESFLRS